MNNLVAAQLVMMAFWMMKTWPFLYIVFFQLPVLLSHQTCMLSNVSSVQGWNDHLSKSSLLLPSQSAHPFFKNAKQWKRFCENWDLVHPRNALTYISFHLALSSLGDLSLIKFVPLQNFEPIFSLMWHSQESLCLVLTYPLLFASSLLPQTLLLSCLLYLPRPMLNALRVHGKVVGVTNSRSHHLVLGVTLA